MQCICLCMCFCVTNRNLFTRSTTVHLHISVFLCFKLCWTHQPLHLYKLLFRHWTFFQNPCRELSKLSKSTKSVKLTLGEMWKNIHAKGICFDQINGVVQPHDTLESVNYQHFYETLKSAAKTQAFIVEGYDYTTITVWKGSETKQLL